MSAILLGETSGLTRQFPQIIKFGAADFAVGHHFDLFRCAENGSGKSLHADTVGDFSSREVGPAAGAGHADDDAFKYLSSLFFAFDNFDMHTHGFAGTQDRGVGFSCWASIARNIHDCSYPNYYLEAVQNDRRGGTHR